MVVKTAVLKELETLYAKSGNQLCVLYGRPDLEKELLCKKRKCIRVKDKIA
mgnify:CR=1 FL=1